mgnify:FL=1
MESVVIKVFCSITLILFVTGCHTTGHNPYGDSEVLNGVIIGLIGGLV